MTDAWVEVSHGIGIPLGGIGTGYCVLGRHGFVNVNFDSTPDRAQSKEYPRGNLWRYDRIPDEEQEFAIVLSEGGRRLLLQEKAPSWLTGADCCRNIKAYSLLPKGLLSYDAPGWDLDVSVSAFSPMIPHDLASSSVPVIILDVAIRNNTPGARRISVGFAHRVPPKTRKGIGVVAGESAATGFACTSAKGLGTAPAAELELGAGASGNVRLYLAWRFPSFSTLSSGAPETYNRYYARRYRDVTDVIRSASERADDWLRKIDRWHDSYDVPAAMKRLWFSSLASIMTSTMLSDDPWFFEIETPHTCVNTMDVCVYSSWVYLVNWPELESMDIRQFLRTIPAEGPDRGVVWHSLWNEGTEYMEEPIFPGRVYRDALWMRDRTLMNEAFEKCLLAAERVLARGNSDRLIVSNRGNQSYDGWMMPGISAFVNSAWLYSLDAIGRMADILGRAASLAGVPIADFRAQAIASYDRLLWNEREGCWRCFHRTPGASTASSPESLFTDQLFGRWLLLIDHDTHGVLPADKVRRALHVVYANNLLEDAATAFRGWTNGMLPGRTPDMDSGIHARTCWIGAQLNLASLLGYAGDEEMSLDVFRSIESSLAYNHLAVGEWNRAVDARHAAVVLKEESGKDTPRFPPYPRYKSSWEYLVRMIGLELDWEHFHLHPFRTVDFRLENVVLAGAEFSISVKRNWTGVKVDGRDAELPLWLPRSGTAYTIAFA